MRVLWENLNYACNLILVLWFLKIVWESQNQALPDPSLYQSYVLWIVANFKFYTFFIFIIPSLYLLEYLNFKSWETLYLQIACEKQYIVSWLGFCWKRDYVKINLGSILQCLNSCRTFLDRVCLNTCKPLTLLQSKIGCILLWNFDAKMPNVCWNTNEAIKGYKRMKGLSYCKHMYIMIITMQFYCISQLLGKINVSKPNVDHPLGFHNGTFLD